MRHGISGNKLSRQQSHRKATVRDIAKATLIAQQICTTKAKAKESRKMVEKLITLGKKGTLADKRRAFAVLNDHALVSQLFGTIAPLFANRKGGYTRIIPWFKRRGDNADMVFLELTEKRVEEKKILAVKKDKKEEAVKNTEKVTTKERVAVKKSGLRDEKVADKKVGAIKKMFQRKAGAA